MIMNCLSIIMSVAMHQNHNQNTAKNKATPTLTEDNVLSCKVEESSVYISLDKFICLYK